jgi:hypothetical protein
MVLPMISCDEFHAGSKPRMFKIAVLALAGAGSAIAVCTFFDRLPFSSRTAIVCLVLVNNAGLARRRSCITHADDCLFCLFVSLLAVESFCGCPGALHIFIHAYVVWMLLVYCCRVDDCQFYINACLL